MGKKLFEFSHKDGHISHYKPTVNILIEAISEDGKIEMKPITDFSVHENLVMYKVHDRLNRFKDFWASDDHSLLAIDRGKVYKISPKEILEKRDKEIINMIYKNPPSDASHVSELGIIFINANELDITLDPSKTTAYDFTVENYFTFRLADGLFVQDSMAAYFTLTEEAEAELRDKVSIDNNLFMDFDKRNLTLQPGHDIVYGIYLLSKRKPEALPKPLHEYMVAQGWDSVNKKRLKEFLVYHIGLDKRNAKIIDEITQLGFTIATKYNQTHLSIENIISSIVPLEKRQALYDRYMKKEISMFEYMEEDEKMTDELKKICVFTDLIESGSRGSWPQAKQMFQQRGFVSNSVGQVMPTPVMRNLAEGLDSRELFLSCYGVRKGIADISDNTAVSGTFTRALIYLGLEAKQGDHKKPCDTKKYLNLNVEDEKMASALFGRYIFLDDECKEMVRVTRENYKTFINQNVRLRSPIYCVNHEYCHYCSPYKELNEIEKGKTYNVGINAAGSLGEPTTQMVLRVFHTSGASGKISDNQDGKQGVVQDLRGTIGLFSKPNFTFQTLPNYLYKIYKTYSEYKEIPMLYFEVLLSCLMWTKSDPNLEEVDVLWRLKQDNTLELVGYNKVPSLYGFLLGCAFKNFKRRLLSSLNKNVGNSIFEKLILGE